MNGRQLQQAYEWAEMSDGMGQITINDCFYKPLHWAIDQEKVPAIHISQGDEALVIGEDGTEWEIGEIDIFWPQLDAISKSEVKKEMVEAHTRTRMRAEASRRLAEGMRKDVSVGDDDTLGRIWLERTAMIEEGKVAASSLAASSIEVMAVVLGFADLFCPKCHQVYEPTTHSDTEDPRNCATCGHPMGELVG